MQSKALKVYILLISILWVAAAHAREPEPVGIATAVKGQVTVVSASGESETVVEGAKVFLGDTFETGDDSGVKILFDDDTLISLGANTTFEITEFVYTPTQRKSISNLTKGKLKSIIQKFEGGESNVEYATPNAVVGVKGTTLFMDADRKLFCVLEGEVFVRGVIPGTREVIIETGQCTWIIDGNPSVPVPFTDELKEEFILATEIKEDVPLRDSLYKEEHPGKQPPPTISETTEEGPSIEDVPTIQPVDLLPGVDAEDRAPVDVIIP
ncbi:MAG: FecR domain-containing protein [Deltaproteobacteria bacterium]|nr:FecR domain-containing protein [Deltaproteobacteria bacterium]